MVRAGGPSAGPSVGPSGKPDHHIEALKTKNYQLQEEVQFNITTIRPMVVDYEIKKNQIPVHGTRCQYMIQAIVFK
jgi:hypothetical protein